MTNTRSGTTPAAIEEMINQRVDAALEACWVNRYHKLGNGNGNGNGTRNGNNRGDNGHGNKNSNVNRRGDRLVARECTYQDFMKCQPLSFKGTEGVVGLIRWSEKMETVFYISNYPERYQMETELWNLSMKNNDMATYTQRFQELTMMCTGNGYLIKRQKRSITDKTEYGNGKSTKILKPKAYPSSMDQS
ncbi:hypothetical protein Tco_1332212 [Tanacetum coccineum]